MCGAATRSTETEYGFIFIGINTIWLSFPRQWSWYTMKQTAVRPISPRGQSRKEMWLTGEKYDWLAT